MHHPSPLQPLTEFHLYQFPMWQQASNTRFGKVEARAPFHIRLPVLQNFSHNKPLRSLRLCEKSLSLFLAGQHPTAYFRN